MADPKITTEEFVALSSAKHGDKYTYEKTVYLGSHKFTTITCKEHGDFEIEARRLLNKGKCPQCCDRLPLTTDRFIAAGRKAYGDRYDYSKSICTKHKDKVIVICPEHGEWAVIANNHVNGKAGCPTCAGNQKSEYEEFVKKATEKHNGLFSYIESDYDNNRSEMHMVCKIHGEFTQTAIAHLAGQGCPTCAGKGYSREHIISRAMGIHGDRYDYSSSVFRLINDYTHITCKVHGPFRQTMDAHINQKQGCPTCVGKGRGLAGFIEDARAVHGDRYDYSQYEYKGNRVKSTIICKVHGPFEKYKLTHVTGASGCPKCLASSASKGQIELSEFVATLCEMETEYKPSGCRKRLDIFIPSRMLAIEFIGNYWHSTANKDAESDNARYKELLKIGIRTIHVYEDEWLSKKEIVKSTLSSILGKSQKTYARKCEVVELQHGEAFDFYDKNHLQGKPGYGKHFALKLNGEIVAGMSFAVWRSKRDNTDKDFWELARYASVGTVVGGASRLLSKFIATGFAKTIVSYSDNRIFDGGMYEALGFTKDHVTSPDYSYITGSVKAGRMHKSGFQKKHLVKMFPGCDVENKTEREICHENGYYQLHDCGKTRWSLQTK